MTVLYITSLQNGAGKSAIAAGIIARLLSEGVKADFVKPVDVAAGGKSGRDTKLIRGLFPQGSREAVAPILMSSSEDGGKLPSLAEQKEKMSGAIAALRAMDTIVAEGWGTGTAVEGLLSENEIVNLLGAKVVLVVRFGAQGLIDAVGTAREQYGDNLVGLVVNRGPQEVDAVTRQLVASVGQKAGVSILGLLPESPKMLGLTVREIASMLKGQILNETGREEDLVESLMIGAITQNPSVEYYAKRSAKAIVARWDRPDQQLGGLETKPACLVVTGGQPPVELIRVRAEDAGVPIVQVPFDTQTMVEKLDALLGTSPFGHERKMEGVRDLMASSFDFTELYRQLGLKVPA